VPGRFQAAVEILVEMVESQSKSIVHGDRSFIAPLALTVFVWIFFMNAMDLLPVDLLPNVWALIYGAAGHDPHHAYMRVVPTADLNATLGMSLACCCSASTTASRSRASAAGCTNCSPLPSVPTRFCGRSTSPCR
jgi:F0F1-type ATP synthase membrane subunit a